MKYIEFVKGVTVGMPDDTPEWNLTIKKWELGYNCVKLYISAGIYDGERKNIILMENELEWNIFVICSAKVPRVNNFYAFHMLDAGQGIDIVWSDRFRTYFISGVGTLALSKDEFENEFGTKKD